MPIYKQTSSRDLRRPTGRENLARAIGECDNNEYNHDVFQCSFCDTTANQMACDLPNCPCGGRGLIVRTTDEKKFKHGWQEGGGASTVVQNKPKDWCGKMAKRWGPPPQHVASQSDLVMPPFLGHKIAFDGQTGNVTQVPAGPVVPSTFLPPGYDTPVAAPSSPYPSSLASAGVSFSLPSETRDESLSGSSWIASESSLDAETRGQRVGSWDIIMGNYLPGQNIGQLSQGAPHSLTEYSIPEAMPLREATVPAEWSILDEARSVLPLPLDVQDWDLCLDDFTGLDLI